MDELPERSLLYRQFVDELAGTKGRVSVSVAKR
jgi:hypothetical protein